MDGGGKEEGGGRLVDCTMIFYRNKVVVTVFLHRKDPPCEKGRVERLVCLLCILINTLIIGRFSIFVMFVCE